MVSNHEVITHPPIGTSEMRPGVGLLKQSMLSNNGNSASNPISAEPTQIPTRGK